MTRKTVRAGVDVVPDLAMFVVHFGFAVLVAVQATEYGVVRGVGVAFAAGVPPASVRTTVNGEGMVERCAGPAARNVAGLAGGREAGRHVIRIRNVLILDLMTGIAACRSAPVHAVHMAISAIHLLVCAGERKCGLAVIESRVLPLARVMAELAVLREPCGQVIGI